MKRCFFVSCILASIIFLCSFISPDTLNEEYRPGYYFDSSGKVEGYISFSYDSYEKFNFKKNLEDKKMTKRVTECSGFSVDGKNFCVIENVEMKIGIWKVTAERAFAEIAVQGRLTLYKVYSMVGRSTMVGGMRTYGADQVVNCFLGRDNSKQYTWVPIGGRQV